MPALGCGLGGLKWSEVQTLIERHLGVLPDLDVYVYEPQGIEIVSSDSNAENTNAQSDVDKISARPHELD